MNIDFEEHFMQLVPLLVGLSLGFYFVQVWWQILVGMAGWTIGKIISDNIIRLSKQSSNGGKN